MLRAYELMVIVDGDVEDPKAQSWVKYVTDEIGKAGGSVHGKPDWWGKRAYAYPINKKEAGYYLVVECLAPGGALDELERQLRLADDIVRHKLIRLPDAEATRRGMAVTAGLSGASHEGKPPMSSNSITLIGNLTRDPELRYTTGGRGVASFGLAVNRRWQQNGEWQEQVSFFNIVCWGDLGENAAATLTKGSRAIVTGRLEQRSWETSDGEKRSVVEVIADELGPSLRWATAQVERTERTGGDGGSSGGGSGGGGGTGGGSSGAGASRAPDPIYGDEEPF